MKDFIEEEIKRRTENAKKLADKFPELKGLSFDQFIEKLPMELDFVTLSEMYDFINSPKTKE